MSSLSTRTQTTLDYQIISHPVIGENFMVSTQNRYATEIGYEILKKRRQCC